MNTYSFHVKYWCPDCGEQFRGQLHIQTREEYRQIGYRRDPCPSCRSVRVSPHVKPGSITEDSGKFTQGWADFALKGGNLI